MTSDLDHVNFLDRGLQEQLQSQSLLGGAPVDGDQLLPLSSESMEYLVNNGIVDICEAKLMQIQQDKYVKLQDLKKLNAAVRAIRNTPPEQFAESYLTKYSDADLEDIPEEDTETNNEKRKIKTLKEIIATCEGCGVTFPSDLPDPDRKETFEKNIENKSNELLQEDQRLQVMVNHLKNTRDTKILLMSTNVAEQKRLSERFFNNMRG